MNDYFEMDEKFANMTVRECYQFLLNSVPEIENGDEVWFQKRNPLFRDELDMPNYLRWKKILHHLPASDQVEEIDICFLALCIRESNTHHYINQLFRNIQSCAARIVELAENISGSGFDSRYAWMEHGEDLQLIEQITAFERDTMPHNH